MARRERTMYSEKRFEPEELKTKLLDEFRNDLCPDLRLQENVFWELGDVKTMLLVFEKWYWRIKSYASLVILISEYQKYQGADIIVTSTTRGLDDLGVEEHLAGMAAAALKNLGFLVKNG